MGSFTAPELSLLQRYARHGLFHHLCISRTYCDDEKLHSQHIRHLLNLVGHLFNHGDDLPLQVGYRHVGVARPYHLRRLLRRLRSAHVPPIRRQRPR